MNHLRFGFGLAGVMLAVLSLAPLPAASQSDRLRGAEAEAVIKAAADKPTPHTADGHPDLNGYWAFPRPPKTDYTSTDEKYLYIQRALNPTVKSTGAGQPRPSANVPPYKPELLAKVKQLADNEVKEDPAFYCKPLGVPRIGPPAQIVQTPKLVAFLYQIDDGEGDAGGNGLRLIPTDGRPHRTDVDPMYLGDSIGRWEEDTLVVDVTHLTDDTWLDIRGYFHSTALHVVERITREGNTLRWDATVEDPNVLTKPWTMSPQTVVLTDDMVVEQPPCQEESAVHIVTGEHHAGDTHETP